MPSGNLSNSNIPDQSEFECWIKQVLFLIFYSSYGKWITETNNEIITNDQI